MVTYSASIKKLETQIGKISTQLTTRQKASFPSDTIVNMNKDTQVLAILSRIGKTLSDLMVDVGKYTNVE